MRGKYITKQILLACLSKSRSRKDIHLLLQETIDERKRILAKWEKSFLGVPQKDIHTSLAETIAERKRILQQWERVFITEQNANYIMEDKKAA